MLVQRGEDPDLIRGLGGGVTCAEAAALELLSDAGRGRAFVGQAQ